MYRKKEKKFTKNHHLWITHTHHAISQFSFVLYYFTSGRNKWMNWMEWNERKLIDASHTHKHTHWCYRIFFCFSRISRMNWKWSKTKIPLVIQYIARQKSINLLFFCIRDSLRFVCSFQIWIRNGKCVCFCVFVCVCMGVFDWYRLDQHQQQQHTTKHQPFFCLVRLREWV